MTLDLRSVVFCDLRSAFCYGCRSPPLGFQTGKRYDTSHVLMFVFRIMTGGYDMAMEYNMVAIKWGVTGVGGNM